MVEIPITQDGAMGQATSSIASEQTSMDGKSEVIVAVMGATGTGKTTFINLASGSKLLVGTGLHSCTNIVQVGQPFELDGRTVTLIDTPGFDDTTRSDADILRMIADFLAVTYKNGMTLSGVIYMHRISDFRMGGISTRNFKMFRKLCGDSTLKNVVIVTNMWSEVSQEVGTRREDELANDDLFFKPVLEKGAIMLRHGNNEDSTHKILRHILENNPVPLQIQQELVDEKKTIAQTAAGAELDRQLTLVKQKYEKEMEELREEMQEAEKEKDEERSRELEKAKEELQRKIDKVQSDAEKLATENRRLRKGLLISLLAVAAVEVFGAFGAAAAPGTVSNVGGQVANHVPGNNIDAFATAIRAMDNFM